MQLHEEVEGAVIVSVSDQTLSTNPEVDLRGRERGGEREREGQRERKGERKEGRDRGRERERDVNLRKCRFQHVIFKSIYNYFSIDRSSLHPFLHPVISTVGGLPSPATQISSGMYQPCHMIIGLFRHKTT